MGPHWTTLDHIGTTLGQHWGNTGATLDHIGVTLGRNHSHCIDDSSFSCFCSIFEFSSMDARQNGYSHLLVATVGHIGVPLGPHWGNIGATLGPHWTTLGPHWGNIGPHWGNIGATLGQHWGNIGATLGQHWTTLGPHWGANIPTALMIPVFVFLLYF